MIDPGIVEAVMLTLKLAALTTLLLMLLAVPFSWWLHRWQHPMRPLVEALVALPLVLPPTVLGFYLLIAFAPDAPMGQGWQSLFGAPLAFSFEGILLGSMLYSLPFAVQPLLSGFNRVTDYHLDAAYTLGLSGAKRFFVLVLPMCKAPLLAAAGLTFAHTIGEFGVVLMIGGNIAGETKVVSIALFDLVETMQYQQAHWLALGLLVFSIICLTLLYRLNRSRGGLWS